MYQDLPTMNGTSNTQTRSDTPSHPGVRSPIVWRTASPHRTSIVAFLLAVEKSEIRRMVWRRKGSEGNPYRISKEGYLHTCSREKGIQEKAHHLHKLQITSFSSQEANRCIKRPTSIKTNHGNEKAKCVNDLVFDCVVLVRLHGLRGILLL